MDEFGKRDSPFGMKKPAYTSSFVGACGITASEDDMGAILLRYLAQAAVGETHQQE
jgi:hypothetical protein